MPSEQELEKIMPLLSKGVNYKYFFDKIGSPDWIEPLMAKGFLKNPPIITGDGRSQLWPESRYLIRMAEKEPALVAYVFLGMQETENFFVQGDMIRAAIKMPANEGVRLVDRVSCYAKGNNATFHAEDLSILASKLVTEGKTDDGIRLFREILDMERSNEEREEIFREVKAHINMYNYGQVIKKLKAASISSAPLEGIKLLRHLLIKAIRLDRRDDIDDREDLLYIWVENVDDDSHADSNVQCALLLGLRSLCEAVIENDPSQKEGVLSLIREQSFVVFDRLEMHLLTKYPEDQERRIVELLKDRNLFQRTSTHKEYNKLLKKNFEDLEEVRITYLGWLSEKPDVEAEKEKWKKFSGKDVAEEDIRKRWRRDTLMNLDGLRSSLPPQWQVKYDKLVKEFGEPKVLELEEAQFLEVGPRPSPKSTQELQQMSVDDVLIFLRDWRAPEPCEWGQVCPAGLATELDLAFEHRFEQFYERTESFLELDATYIRTFLHVIGRKRRDVSDFNWVNVLDLCKWIVAQPMELQGWKHDRDNDWSGAQSAVIHLIEEGLTDYKGGIPFKQRRNVWACIEPLTKSPDPTKERESESITDSSHYDPIHLAINSVRGSAIEAVIRYALWVKQHESPNEAIDNFEGMDEVRIVLDEHLKISEDPLLAIRAIYGEWFPHLTILGARWSEENKDTIFPSQDEVLKDYMRAAWNTYIQYCKVYDNVFNLIRDKYEWAIDQIGREGGESGRSGRIDRNLGRHLIRMYAREILKENESLWIKFWQEAPRPIRKDAIEYCGRLLKWPTPAKPLERLKNLLDNRIKTISEVGQNTDELVSFGWWFESDALTNEWLLDHLMNVLELTKGKIEWEHKVLERLAQMLPNKPLEVLGVLEKIARGFVEVWSMATNKEEFRGILQEALENESTDVKKAATDLIHYLGAMGYQEFGELLLH